ncbi:MAG: hypothetical protein J6R99_02470 [Alphaproteobacteria bacterium]|jgi:hypothetical protein|nr:hypothetical protein [Alphaproteobacteria bacterium]
MTNKENANTQVLMNSDFSFLFGKIRLAPNITHETAIQLVSALSKRNPNSNSCAVTVSAKYNCSAIIYNAFGQKHLADKIVIDIVFADKSKKIKCNKNCDKMTGRQCAEMCVKNIQSGKCIDPMVRDTIGVTLFPELYQKQK